MIPHGDRAEGPAPVDRNSMPAKKMKPPQQKNEYDCGLYMLHFIEKICSNDLPSFKSADEIFAHFHRGGGAHFEKEEIETKRTDFHRVLAAMARAAKVDLHPEDDHEGDHESE